MSAAVCTECGISGPVHARNRCRLCYERMYRLGDRVRIHQEFTIPELRRAKQLADAGMACGAIAIALRVDFQTERTGDTIRKALKRYFPGWRACSPSANNGRPQNFERAGK